MIRRDPRSCGPILASSVARRSLTNVSRVQNFALTNHGLSFGPWRVDDVISGWSPKPTQIESDCSPLEL